MDEHFESSGNAAKEIFKSHYFDDFYMGQKFVTKGLRKNNFTELAPKFRSDLAAPIEQIHRNSSTISRILRLRRRQR